MFICDRGQFNLPCSLTSTCRYSNKKPGVWKDKAKAAIRYTVKTQKETMILCRSCRVMGWNCPRSSTWSLKTAFTWRSVIAYTEGFGLLRNRQAHLYFLPFVFFERRSNKQSNDGFPRFQGISLKKCDSFSMLAWSFLVHTFASFALPTNGTRTIETWARNRTLSVIVAGIGQTWIPFWITMGRKHQRKLSRYQQYFRKQENAHEKHWIRYIGSPADRPKPTENPWSM